MTMKKLSLERSSSLKHNKAKFKFIFSQAHFHQKKCKRKRKEKEKWNINWEDLQVAHVEHHAPSISVLNLQKNRQDFSLPGKALLHARKWDPEQHIKQLSFLCSNQWAAHLTSHITDDLSCHGRAFHKPTSSGLSPHVHGNQAIYRGVDVAMMQVCLPRSWILLNPRWGQTGWTFQCTKGGDKTFPKTLKRKEKKNRTERNNIVEQWRFLVDSKPWFNITKLAESLINC